MNTAEKQFPLTPAACDEIADLIMDFCVQMKAERRDALRYRLSAEECLLFYLENGCEGNTVTLRMGKRLRAPFISLEIEGGAANPYLNDEEEYGDYCGNLLVNLELSPDYHHENGKNCFLYRIVRRSRSQLATIGIVLVVALLVGLAGQALLPDNVRSLILETFIIPIYDTFFNILGCAAGPMIFLSVAWGLYGIGDTATLGRVGKKIILRYLLSVFGCAALGMLLFPLLGPALSFGASGNTQMAGIMELLLGIFPPNIVDPFSTGNSLQIIFLAITFGIAMLFLGRQTRSVAAAIEQVNYIVQFLMRIISRLVPYVIFLVVVNMFWSGSLASIRTSWKPIVFLLLAVAVIAFVYVFLTATRYKVSPMLLVKKGIPTFLIALSTASSAASYSSNVATCQKQYGVDASLTSFGIPLGMVMHKPVTAVYHLILVFFFAKIYDVPCSPSWLVIALIISAILAIAVPPIPGGGAIAYTMLFQQMGIPSEALAITLTLDVLVDFLLTSFEMFLLPFSLINSAGSLAMLDVDILKSGTKRVPGSN